MNFIILITTYKRQEYLKQLLDSFFATINQKNNWQIIIHNDCSDKIDYDFPIKPIIINSKRIGVHKATNKLFNACRDFDMAFKCDDDIFFLQTGWERLYYNFARDTNNWHLSYKNIKWKYSGHTITDTLGCFYTITPEILKTVGYIDTENMGFRGIGHIDYSMRCCRAGFNNIRNFQYPKNIEKYIDIHSGSSYIGSLSHNEVIKNRQLQNNKLEVAQQERIYICE